MRNRKKEKERNTGEGGFVIWTLYAFFSFDPSTQNVLNVVVPSSNFHRLYLYYWLILGLEFDRNCLFFLICCEELTVNWNKVKQRDIIKKFSKGKGPIELNKESKHHIRKLSRLQEPTKKIRFIFASVEGSHWSMN